ncbi:MAG: diguanylate cyclase [Chloroflexota bacterium]|nr:diguanylate cyclase [Chloroflexota bacterium]
MVPPDIEDTPHLSALRVPARFAAVRARFRLSLTAQIVVLVVGVAVVTGGGVGIALVESTRNALREDSLRSSLAAADLAAALTADRMQGIWQSARELAARPAVRRAAGDGSLGSLTPVLREWLTQNPQVDDAAVYDLNGLNLASAQADQSVVGVASVWDRPWFQAARSSGVSQQGGATISPTTGRPAAPYHVPILDDTEHMRGMLSAMVSLTTLSDTLQRTDLGVNATVSLVDLDQGVYLASPDPAEILQPVDELGEATPRLLAGERRAMVASSQEGTVLAAFAGVSELPWAVLVEQPSADVFAPATEMTYRGGLWIALAVALAASLGMGAASHISVPLRKLRRTAEGMARGELDRRANLTQTGEVGELGLAFDRMASWLQETMALLRLSEDQSRRESERLLALHAASSALSAHSATPEAVLDQILSSAVTLLHAGSGSLYRWDAEASLLRCVRNWGVPAADTTPDLRINEGLAGRTFGQGSPLILNDYAASAYATQSGRIGGMRAGLGVPLVWGGSRIGVLLIRAYSDDATRFDEDDARFTSLFGDQASAVMFTAEAFEQQRFAALHDSLTGLPNRRMLRERLQTTIAVGGDVVVPTAVLLLDLDDFKQVNDTLGHVMGDALLREVGQRLTSTVRTSDLVSRLGGDEFCVLLPDTTLVGAQQVAASLLEVIDQPFVLESHVISIGVSIGVALYPDHGLTPDALMRSADLAMYAAKRGQAGSSVYTIAA